MGRGDFSIGGQVWPGLSKLIEEAGEVTQVARKIIGARGVDDHWDGSKLRGRLEEELGDLLAAITFVIELNGLDLEAVVTRSIRKGEKFLTWHKAPENRPSSEGDRFIGMTVDEIAKATVAS